MKERPIVFSSPMVRAILAGEKTQTRRILSPQPVLVNGGRTWEWPHESMGLRDGETMNAKMRRARFSWWSWGAGLRRPMSAEKFCPYGGPGDRLWCRERMRVLFVDVRASQVAIRREADGAEGRVPYPARLAAPKIGKCLAYGGHREASRIDLEIEAVRVERLQDITEGDIAAEGVNHESAAMLLHGGRAAPLRDLWRLGWDAINGRRSPWSSNPWVWVINFRRVRP